jgi:prenyl protein peptidase
MSNSTIIFLTPFVFGLAHFHHFYEYRITHPDTPVIGAILRSVFQLSYTTLFGGYATFVFMRTGSLFSVIVLHAFCNWMGLPRFWGRLSGTETVIGPDVGQTKKSEDGAKISTSTKLGIAWTIAYYMLLVAGAFGWYKMLWLWTESQLHLSDFSEA